MNVLRTMCYICTCLYTRIHTTSNAHNRMSLSRAPTGERTRTVAPTHRTQRLKLFRGVDNTPRKPGPGLFYAFDIETAAIYACGRDHVARTGEWDEKDTRVCMYELDERTRVFELTPQTLHLVPKDLYAFDSDGYRTSNSTVDDGADFERLCRVFGTDAVSVRNFRCRVAGIVQPWHDEIYVREGFVTLVAESTWGYERTGRYRAAKLRSKLITEPAVEATDEVFDRARTVLRSNRSWKYGFEPMIAAADKCGIGATDAEIIACASSLVAQVEEVACEKTTVRQLADAVSVEFGLVKVDPDAE